MEQTKNGFEELNQYRENADKSLRAEYSWLALTGLFWLEEGENSFGTDLANLVTLPDGSAPAQAGVFTLTDGVVSVQFAEGVNGMVNGEALAQAEMKPDTAGEPTEIKLNDLKMVVIERGTEFGIRIWDKNNPKRTNFEGRKWHEPNHNFRVTAKITLFNPPKKVPMVNQIGDHFEGEMDAKVIFDLNGVTNTLDVTELSSGALYIMFKDGSSGESTYPPGRYLVTEIAEGDTVVIDFNKAYSPPCAFTDFATCTLPHPQNILSITVEAGEKYNNLHK